MKKKRIHGFNASPIQDTRGEKVFYFLNAAFLVIFALLTLYPILVLISNSISDPYEVYTGHVTFYPKGFSLEGYRLVLKNGELLSGFKNSIIYTVVGTLLNVGVTFITAYALSRRELKGRNFFSFFFAFTMWFSGGTIPLYLLVRDLGLMNNMWAVILPGLMSVWNMIVCRTYIQTTIPHEIFEAASIDGCGYWRYMVLMVIPLSGAILAILTLWYAIGHWNSYFYALIFLLDKKLHPVQLLLRQYLVALKAMNVSDLAENTSEMYGIADIMVSLESDNDNGRIDKAIYFFIRPDRGPTGTRILNFPKIPSPLYTKREQLRINVGCSRFPVYTFVPSLNSNPK